MTLPALLFGCIVAGFAGSVFHLLTGGSGGRLVMYLLVGLAGFWIGHAIGVALGWDMLRVGVLRFGMGMVGCLLALGAGYLVTQGRPTQKR